MTRPSRGPGQGVLLGLLAQVLQVGVGLFIMPLALHKLSSAEIGLWYVFFTVQSLVLLLDFGFTQTFSRSFSYIYAGARRLLKEGVDPGGGDELNPDLLAAAVVAARRLYLMISGIALLALLSAGTWYVVDVASVAGMALPSVIGAWLLFVASIFLSVYFQWQTALLAGANLVSENYRVAIFSRVTQLAFSLGGLLIFPSVLTLAFGYLMSIIVFRAYGSALIRDRLPGLRRGDATRSPQSAQELFAVMRPNASRLGWVALGAFLITRFIFFAITSFLGLEVSGQYAIAFQALMVTQGVAQVVFSLRLPQIAGARVRGEIAVVKRLFLQSMMFSWSVMLVLGLALVFLGPELLLLIKSRTVLPTTDVLVLMLVVWFLETNHANCATLIVTGNRVPFVGAALTSGAAVALGLLLVGWAGGSLLAFVAVQGWVQLLYNNWKWPVVVAKEIQLTYSDLRVILKETLWS